MRDDGREGKEGPEVRNEWESQDLVTDWIWSMKQGKGNRWLQGFIPGRLGP